MNRLITIFALAATATACGGADDGALFGQGETQASSNGPGVSDPGLDAGPETGEKPTLGPRTGETPGQDSKDDSGAAVGPDTGPTVPGLPGADAGPGHEPDPEPDSGPALEPEPRPPETAIECEADPDCELEYECETSLPRSEEAHGGVCMTETEYEATDLERYWVNFDVGGCGEAERCIACVMPPSWTGVCDHLPQVEPEPEPDPDDPFACDPSECPPVDCVKANFEIVGGCGTVFCDNEGYCDVTCDPGWEKPNSTTSICEEIRF